MDDLALSCISAADEELAGHFAYELARDPSNAYAIATRLTYGDFSKALEMVNTWRNDAAFQVALREAQKAITALDMLRSKEEFALEVQDKMGAMTGKMWIEAAKFYADLRGFIKKEEVPTTLIQNVIQVPADMSLDEWERNASASQRKLQDEARVINGDSDV